MEWNDIRDKYQVVLCSLSHKKDIECREEEEASGAQREIHRYTDEEVKEDKRRDSVF